MDLDSPDVPVCFICDTTNHVCIDSKVDFASCAKFVFWHQRFPLLLAFEVNLLYEKGSISAYFGISFYLTLELQKQ